MGSLFNHTTAIALLLLSSCCLSAPADDELTTFVQRTVRVLDSPLLSQRQAAEKLLIETGPQVLDLLPAESTELSAETKKRLATIRQTLYSQIALTTTQPTKVTLTGEFSVETVFQQLREQTRNEVGMQNIPQARLALDIRELPFHQALDQILAAAKLKREPFLAPHPGQIWVLPDPDAAKPKEGFVDYTSVFRIAAIRIASARSLESNQAKRCSLTLQIGWEPRLRPLYLTLQGDQFSATDDTQTKIPCLLNSERTLSVEGNAAMIQMEVPLDLPKPEATKLTSVTGKLQTLIPGRRESFRFADLNDPRNLPRQEQRAGVIIGLEQVIHRESEIGIRIKLHYSAAGDAFASHRGWINRNPAYLSHKGNPLDLTPRRETVDQSAQSNTYIFWFKTSMELSQLEFHYDTPALFLQKQIEFQLHDIPLP